MTSSIQHISVDAVLRPINEASGLPNAAYVDPDFALQERDSVLAKNWTAIGFASDLPEPGYAKPVSFLGLPLLITRSKDDDIRVFHNVCSHRGRILVEEEGPVGNLLRCPYHFWTYDLTGGLRGTPHIGGVNVHTSADFDCANHGLKPVRTSVWMDIIFVNLSEDAQAFEDHIAPLIDRWECFVGASGLSKLRCSPKQSKITMELKSNWKLIVDNYCESYHLPFVHPDLNRYSRLEDHYDIIVEDRFAGQGSYTYNLSDEAGLSLPRFSEWPEERIKEAEYISVYPNVLLGAQRDHAFAIVLEPHAKDRTVEQVALYYADAAVTGPDWQATPIAAAEHWARWRDGCLIDAACAQAEAITFDDGCFGCDGDRCEQGVWRGNGALCFSD